MILPLLPCAAQRIQQGWGGVRQSRGLSPAGSRVWSEMHVSVGRREFRAEVKVRGDTLCASWNDFEAARTGKVVGFSEGTSTGLTEKAEENWNTKFPWLRQR